MMDAGFYKKEILKMRRKYKRRPLRDIKLDTPQWLNHKDPMAIQYAEKSTLLKQGKITYACIVQANEILFKKSPKIDCASNIFFSTDLLVAENPKVLYDISRKLFGYKGLDEEKIPETWREMAAVITDEYDRTHFTFNGDFGGTGKRQYRMIPTIIYRKLLPEEMLCGKILPILFAPGCEQIIILPKKYWSRNFKKTWVGGYI